MPFDLVHLPAPLEFIGGVFVVYRWGFIPAVRGTLGMLRDWRRFKQEPLDRSDDVLPVRTHGSL